MAEIHQGDFSCFITGWNSIFEQISWMINDKYIFNSHLSPPGGVTV